MGMAPWVRLLLHKLFLAGNLPDLVADSDLVVS